MGAYLSEPLTTKDSSDEANELIASGSSSMQGWRISQEDAHNCILDFDSGISFFAVYDGHGGSEVAKYCSLFLPNFLKDLEAYKQKNFEQALKDAFIGFDATLLEESVVEELKAMMNTKRAVRYEAVDEEDNEEGEEEEDDNVDVLCKEACMPLPEVLQRYKKDGSGGLPLLGYPGGNKTKEGNCSKPPASLIKVRRRLAPVAVCRDVGSSGAGPSKMTAAVFAEASSIDSKDAASTDAVDSTVSSSSSNKIETTPVMPDLKQEQEPTSSSPTTAATASAVKSEAEQSNEISDTEGNVPAKSSADGGGGRSLKQECAPDSSSSDNSKQLSSATQNGDVADSCAAGKSATSSLAGAVSSSSMSPSCENGVVSSDGEPMADPMAGIGSSCEPFPNGVPWLGEIDTDDSETDEEYPAESSSTEDGEEDTNRTTSEECSEELEEEGEYEEEEEDFMNEEDEAFMNNILDEAGKDSGCTAVVALLHERDLYVANAGDSRCVVCRNGKAQEMSFDHKPEDKIEFDRIQKAGGRVTLDGRVNGGLNLSRAIGDHGYKMNKKLPPEEQMISALPDIQKITIGPEDQFMVLACDGIWNFMSSDDVVMFVQERISNPNVKLSKICEEMFDHCLAPHTKGDGTGCDNMTAIIVKFKPNLVNVGSRKRAASPAIDGAENAAESAPSGSKKPKTDSIDSASASSTTTTVDGSTVAAVSGGPAVDGEDASMADTEAQAAVASIASTTDVAGSSAEATSSSST